MREGWTTKQIGDLCTIRPPKKEARANLDDNAEVGFLPMEDLGIRQQAVTTLQTRALGEVYKGYTYFADGDVLLAKITPCFQNGKLGIARDLPNGVGFGSSEYFVLRSNGEILPEYLFYFLSQDTFTDGGVRQMSGAVGHQRVPPEYVASQEIPLPPLAEQKRIVEILDEAFEAIERAEACAREAIARLPQLTTCSRTTLGGPLTTLGELTEIQSRFRNSNEAVEGGKYPFYTCGRTPLAIDEYDFDCEAVLLAGNNASADFNVKHVNGRFSVRQRVYVITARDPEIADARFLYWQLVDALQAFKAQAVGTTTKFIKIGMVRSVSIPALPLAKQRQIATQRDRLQESIDRLRGVYDLKQVSMASLRSALLSQAFSGHLTSNESSIEPSGAIA